LGWVLHSFGLLHLRRGHADAALPPLEEALRIFFDTRDQSGIVLVLHDMAAVAEQNGNSDRYLRLKAAATALQSTTGTNLATLVNEFEGRSDNRGDLPDALRSAYTEGLAMSLEQAVDYALGADGVTEEPAAIV
jgi:hypothetical protein